MTQITKINSYAVTDVLTPSMDKINAYAVIDSAPSQQVTKIIAYAVIDEGFIPPVVGGGASNFFMFM